MWEEGSESKGCPPFIEQTLWPYREIDQAPPSMGFSRQECWNGLPFPSPGDLPTQESNPGLPHCRQTLYHLSHQGSLKFMGTNCLMGKMLIVQKMKEESCGM